MESGSEAAQLHHGVSWHLASVGCGCGVSAAIVAVHYDACRWSIQFMAAGTFHIFTTTKLLAYFTQFPPAMNIYKQKYSCEDSWRSVAILHSLLRCYLAWFTFIFFYYSIQSFFEYVLY